MTAAATQEEDGNAVTAWFGDGFGRLHPLLQALHRDSGRLSGPIDLQFGRGLAGLVGRRIARRFGLPDAAGQHHLDVEIRHDAAALQWNRCFDRSQRLSSTFRPSGHWPDGHWIETTGPLVATLTVAVIEGGWHWRVVGIRLHGIALPRWLRPRSTAYKRIENGRYRFYVGFSLPVLGEMFRYRGLLALAGEG